MQRACKRHGWQYPLPVAWRLTPQWTLHHAALQAAHLPQRNQNTQMVHHICRRGPPGGLCCYPTSQCIAQLRRASCQHLRRASCQHCCLAKHRTTVSPMMQGQKPRHIPIHWPRLQEGGVFTWQPCHHARQHAPAQHQQSARPRQAARPSIQPPISRRFTPHIVRRVYLNCHMTLRSGQGFTRWTGQGQQHMAGLTASLPVEIVAAISAGGLPWCRTTGIISVYT